MSSQQSSVMPGGVDFVALLDADDDDGGVGGDIVGVFVVGC